MYIYKSLSKFNETFRLNRCEKPLSLFFCTENVVINQEQNLFSRNHLLYFHYVIKELVHAFSCAYIELWMHLGSLESTQEARVALGYALSNSYTSLVLSKLPDAKHEPILKCPQMIPILKSPNGIQLMTGALQVVAISMKRQADGARRI